jgi:hypothetical protein
MSFLCAAVFLSTMPAATLQATCLEQFNREMSTCSGLDSFFDRSVCGVSAEIDLAACLDGALTRG